MIKAAAKLSDGSVLLVLGLSGENIRRLQAGDPIAFDIASVGLPATERVRQITIFYGATEADCYRQIRSLISDKTIVHAVPPPPTGSPS